MNVEVAAWLCYLPSCCLTCSPLSLRLLLSHPLPALARIRSTRRLTYLVVTPTPLRALVGVGIMRPIRTARATLTCSRRYVMGVTNA